MKRNLTLVEIVPKRNIYFLSIYKAPLINYLTTYIDFNNFLTVAVNIVVINAIHILVGEDKRGYFCTNILSNAKTEIEVKFHATARGLQPPACCGNPAMWWMAKRLHRVVSARVVAKWSILVEREVWQNCNRAEICQRSKN